MGGIVHTIIFLGGLLGFHVSLEAWAPTGLWKAELRKRHILKVKVPGADVGLGLGYDGRCLLKAQGHGLHLLHQGKSEGLLWPSAVCRTSEASSAVIFDSLDKLLRKFLQAILPYS